MSVTIEPNTSEQHRLGMYFDCAPHYVHIRVALLYKLWPGFGYVALRG
jgi:hypothetical protein